MPSGRRGFSLEGPCRLRGERFRSSCGRARHMPPARHGFPSLLSPILPPLILASQSFTGTSLYPLFSPSLPCSTSSNPSLQVLPQSCLTQLLNPNHDLLYTNQFFVPEVTSVFFSSCDSVVGDFLEFNQANRGSLCV